MVASNWQPTAHLRYAAVSGQMQQLWERECRETREYNGRPRLCTWTEQQWRDIPFEQPTQETLADRQREPDAVEKQALYGNLRKLYRRDVPDETLDHSKPECPNTHAGKHIPGESYKVCWYCQL